MASLEEYTSEEVAEHKTKNDLWIVVHGKGEYQYPGESRDRSLTQRSQSTMSPNTFVTTPAEQMFFAMSQEQTRRQHTKMLATLKMPTRF